MDKEQQRSSRGGIEVPKIIFTIVAVGFYSLPTPVVQRRLLRDVIDLSLSGVPRPREVTTAMQRNWHDSESMATRTGHSDRHERACLDRRPVALELQLAPAQQPGSDPRSH